MLLTPRHTCRSRTSLAPLSVCTPFPTEVFPTLSNTGDKDFLALHQALEALPHVHSLLGSDDGIAGLPPAALSLLKWLLLNPARRRRFTLTSLSDMVRQLRQRSDAAWQLPAIAGNNTPAFILQAHDSNSQVRGVLQRSPRNHAHYSRRGGLSSVGTPSLGLCNMTRRPKGFKKWNIGPSRRNAGVWGLTKTNKLIYD